MTFAIQTKMPEKKRQHEENGGLSTANSSLEKESTQEALTGIPLFLQRSVESSSPPPVQRQYDEVALLQKKKSAQPGYSENEAELEAKEQTVVQAKLKIGSPDDEYEREADSVADSVMRMPVSHYYDGSTIQRKSSGVNKNSSEVPGSVKQVIHSSGVGSSLSQSVRAGIEPVLGADLSGVRVHQDAIAQSAAKDINAKAFTHKNSIFLGSGESASDIQLMAHEATHVMQQGAVQHDAKNLIQRYPYETRSIDLSRTDITTMAGSNYWEQRTWGVYSTRYDPRMGNDAEERDAVYAAFWASNPPRSLRRTTNRNLYIASRQIPAAGSTAARTAPQLHYTVTINPPAARGQKPRLTFAYQSSGAAAAAPARATQHTPPADYRGRDAVDVEFEKLRSTSRSRANRLGTVTLPANIPADERVPAKFAVWQYFAFGNQARNTQVDAIVPVGRGSRNALYTIIFGRGNNVTLTRIGEEGTGAGQIDLDRISVTRVRGFPGTTATPAALRTWWSTRYPRGGALTTAANSTATTLIADMNRLITVGIANRNWFNNNYNMEAMSSTDTAARLQDATIHNVPANLLTDTVNFSQTDLKMLELSLQTLSASDIANLNGVKIGRKQASITRNSNGTYSAGGANQYGMTLMNSSGGTRYVTVLYFGPVSANNVLYDNDQFRGSTAANALPVATMRMLHELGHATGFVNSAIERAFNARFPARRFRNTLTWYAASNRQGHEIFPEAYGLYHTDPGFLCRSSGQMYAWCELLASTGTAPTARTRLRPPANCP